MIEKPYQLQQLRETFASYAINEIGLDIYIVQKLLDHSNIDITDKHYVKINLAKTRKELNYFDFDED